MPAVLRLDATNPALRMLLPQAQERLEAHAVQYQPEENAVLYARAFIARVVMADPSVCLTVLVDEATAKLVGHVLAHRDLANPLLVTIAQARAGDAEGVHVGDALERAVEQAVQWAQQLPQTKVVLFTGNDRKDWQQRLGFKRQRSVMYLPLNGAPHDRGGAAGSAGPSPGFPAARGEPDAVPSLAGVPHGAGA